MAVLRCFQGVFLLFFLLRVSLGRFLLRGFEGHANNPSVRVGHPWGGVKMHKCPVFVK